MSPIDIAVLILRAWVGIVMVVHGVNHGRNLDGTADWFSKIGFRQPKLQAMLSSAMEVSVGIGFAVGFLTSLDGAAILATMFVAFWTVHRFQGFWVWKTPEGYEYVVTVGLVASAVAIAGPGDVSVDAVLGIDLSGWIGAAIVGAGWLVAVMQLAIFWRRPATPEDG